MSDEKAYPILRILGMKDKMPQKLIKAIVEKAEAEKAVIHIETCIGGAGLQPTRMLLHPEKATWILNDIEEDKTDLYYVVCYYPLVLRDICEKIISDICPCFQNKADNKYDDEKEHIHTMIREQIQKIDGITDSDKIIRAAITMLDYAGYKNDVAHQFAAFKKHTNNISALRSRMKVSKATITNADLFDVIKKYKNKEDVILYVDPPYYLTDGGYPEDLSEYEEHKKLCAHLHKAKCKWVLFCRIEASRSHGKSANSRLVDDALRCFYENNYLFNGHYSDKWTCSKTQELVITNFEFDGCTSYDFT